MQNQILRISHREKLLSPGKKLASSSEWVKVDVEEYAMFTLYWAKGLMPEQMVLA